MESNRKMNADLEHAPYAVVVFLEKCGEPKEYLTNLNNYAYQCLTCLGIECGTHAKQYC